MKAVQLFSEQYLRECKKMTTTQVVKFLDDFAKVNANSIKPEKLKLISIKMPPTLLSAFREKSKLEGIAYQSKIKELMQQWVVERED